MVPRVIAEMRLSVGLCRVQESQKLGPVLKTPKPNRFGENTKSKMAVGDLDLRHQAPLIQTLPDAQKAR